MRIGMWPTLIPFVSVGLIVAMLAAGIFWKSIKAVVFIAWFSTLYAIVLTLWFAGLNDWLKCAVYAGFAALYLYAAHSLVNHLNRARDREYELGDASELPPYWSSGLESE